MKRILLIAAGYTSLSVGVAGIFLPLLPTTPFLLLAAACFLRSSDSLYHWLIHHKLFGNYIRCYRQYRAISLRSKIISLLLLWLCIGYSVIIFVSALWLRLILIIIAAGVTTHILRLRTTTKEMMRQLK